MQAIMDMLTSQSAAIALCVALVVAHVMVLRYQITNLRKRDVRGTLWLLVMAFFVAVAMTCLAGMNEGVDRYVQASGSVRELYEANEQSGQDLSRIVVPLMTGMLVGLLLTAVTGGVHVWMARQEEALI